MKKKEEIENPKEEPRNPKKQREKIVQLDREDEQFVCGYEKTQFDLFFSRLACHKNNIKFMDWEDLSIEDEQHFFHK